MSTELIPDAPFIACGMYVFDDATRNAWTSVLSGLGKYLPGSFHTTQSLPVVYSDADSVLNAPNMVLGHTCGYPLITRWQHSHHPVSVPCFDVPGCDGERYCSWLVCAKDDPRADLAGFRGSPVAINGKYSNSGMNVLRHAIAALQSNKDSLSGSAFFDEIIVSGSHAQSMYFVAEGRADIAAIDAVSYHHLLRCDPTLARRTRILDATVFSTGLPFVVHAKITTVDQSTLSRQFTDALNLALQDGARDAADVLRLQRFEAVTHDNFIRTREIAAYAAKRGFIDWIDDR